MSISEVWNMYTPRERRNIAIYILGIMLYKYGLEAFNGSITSLATDRFTARKEKAFLKVGLMQGFNQAMQCVGSILIAPLIKRFPTRSVLSVAILVFGILPVILLIADSATGGHIKNSAKPTYGTYSPNAIYPVYLATGVAYGMVELIRRVIPRDIVGGHVGKLKRMDAIVHVLYEVAGTVGAFSSATIIKKLGNNYSFLITPPCFVLAAIVWRFVSADFSVSEETKKQELADELGSAPKQTNYASAVLAGFRGFGQSVAVGSRIVFSQRKFWWLVPGYSFALFGHRFLENDLGNIFAKVVLKDSSYRQIIVGGSNLGELFGALSVLFLANRIHTPMPFLRLDALLLLIVWYLPYYYPAANDVNVAWKIAASFIPISFGWAAGDVSLAAYIQSSLARVESSTKDVSALGAVMSFLYVTYISLYALLSPTIGLYVDRMTKSGRIHEAFIYIGGVHFTILAVIIFASTFVPHGAVAFNPKLLTDEDLNHDLEYSQEKTINEKVAGSDSSVSSDRKLSGEQPVTADQRQ